MALKSIAKVPNQKVTRWPKCFSFFLFFFRRASLNLRDSFTIVFTQNSIFHWAVHQPIAFFQVWSHTRWFEPLTELWLPVRRLFFFTCTHVQNHLATKYITQDCWIRNTVGRLGVFEESQYCIGSLWGETYCSSMHLLLKKVTWTRMKSIKNVARCRDSRSVGMIPQNSSVHNSTLHIFPHQRCWSAIPTSCNIFNVYSCSCHFF